MAEKTDSRRGNLWFTDSRNQISIRLFLANQSKYDPQVGVLCVRPVDLLPALGKQWKLKVENRGEYMTKFYEAQVSEKRRSLWLSPDPSIDPGGCILDFNLLIER